MGSPCSYPVATESTVSSPTVNSSARSNPGAHLLYTNPSFFLPPQPATLVAGSSTANDVHVWSPMAAAFHHAQSPFSVLRPHGSGHLAKQSTITGGQPQWSSALLSAYMMHLLPVPPQSPRSPCSDDNSIGQSGASASVSESVSE